MKSVQGSEEVCEGNVQWLIKGKENVGNIVETNEFHNMV